MDLIKRDFDAFIDDWEHVYDGDTINHCYVKVPELRGVGDAIGEIYPDWFVKNGAVCIHINVRLAGIDCPELHPRHRLTDGTRRDPSDVAWEHSLALEARRLVQDLLSASDLKFTLRNPEIGKYAGRIVAEVWCKDLTDTSKLVNVSELLLNKGLAYKYEGGTKQVWKHPKNA